MEDNVLNALSQSMVRAVERAASSTVRVDGRGRMGASGVVYQPDMVLTASHVVEREENIRIELPDGTVVGAIIAGRDPASDLCLLRMENAGGIPGEPAREVAQVGQIVLSLGRPDGDGIQASMGVVGAVGGPIHSGRGALLERFIRTDAIPYPGFSGGPLVDGDGLILGINTSGFAPGASLAVPASLAWRIAQSLSQYGRIRRGYLGIRSQAVELPETNHGFARGQRAGLLVVGVERGQPADRAGLMVGDILVEVNSRKIEDHDTLLECLSGDTAGKVLPVEILRGGRLQRLDVTIGEAPGVASRRNNGRQG